MTTDYKKHNLDRNSNGASWGVRRRIIILTLLFCASLSVYITAKGVDSRTAETIVQSAFALAGAVIGSYCFAATWEDKAKIDNLNINTGPQTNIDPTTINPTTINPSNVDNPD